MGRGPGTCPQPSRAAAGGSAASTGLLPVPPSPQGAPALPRRGSRRDTPTVTSLILSAMFLPVCLLLAISPKTLIRSDLLWVSVNKVVFPSSHPEPRPPPVLPQAPSRREARPAPGLWPPRSASHLTLQHPLLEQHQLPCQVLGAIAQVLPAESPDHAVCVTHHQLATAIAICGSRK